MANIQPIPDTPVPSPGGAPGGLGEKLKNALMSFLVDTLNRVKETLAGIMRYAVDITLETLEGPLLSIAGPLLDKAIADPNVPAEVRGILQSARSGEHQVGALLVLAAAVFVVPPTMNALFSGTTQLVRYVSNKTFRPFRLDFGTLWRASLLNAGYADDLTRELVDQGWTQKQIDTAKLASWERLGAGDVLAAYHRKEITQGEASQRLTERGIATEDLGLIFALARRIPGPADLVRFAQREVWRDDVASKYGYDADYSPAFGEWLEKQGYGLEWAKAYHRARWQLPGIATGLNLLHRRSITEGEFKDLLMVQDIPQWWRNKIFDAAYSPYTRVDIRRMYQAGKVTEQQVYNNYRDIGYDDEHARFLTEWTLDEYSQDESNLTRSAVERAYDRGLLARGEAVTMLAEIGIRGEAANLYLDIVDYDKAIDRQDDRAKGIRKLFESGQIAESEARSRLAGIGVVSDRIADMIEEWRINLSTKVKMPTRSNLESFVKDGVIDPGQFSEEMRKLNYPDVYIGWYTQAIAIERLEQAAKEEREARTEQERIGAAKVKTDYQRAKAEIDVHIAELRAAIADDQLSIVTAENERDQALAQAMSLVAIAEIEREYTPLLREAEAAIASSRLEIVEAQAAIKTLQAEAEQVRVSLAENRDVAAGVELRAERLELQTENARLAELVRQRQTVLARLEQQLVEAPGSITEEEALLIEAQAKVEIAEFRELQTANTVRIEEGDQALQETLSETQRQELEVRRATIQASVAELNTEIANLNIVIRQAEQAKAEYGQEMQDRIDLLPGAAEQVEIRLYYDRIIDEIKANIKQYQQNIAELQLAKSRLTAEWRIASE